MKHHLLPSLWRVPASIRRTILAGFFLQASNSCYLMIGNFFLLKNGYTDTAIARLTSLHFLFILLISLVVGFWMKGRPLLPLFRVVSLLAPILSLLYLWAVTSGHHELAKFSYALYGASNSVFMVGVIPFVIREANTSIRSESIALHFSGWSLSSFFSGAAVYIAHRWVGDMINEETALRVFTVISFAAPLLLFNLKHKEALPHPGTAKSLRQLEWRKILLALLPNFIIGIGAGMTMPFMNLFFHHQFKTEFDTFALFGAVSTLLVSFASMLGPSLNRRYGSVRSVITTKALGIVALVCLAFTEWLNPTPLAYAIAVFFYWIRQPFMNMSWPQISEFTMDYVGEDSREIVSSLRGAVWSGSWFFSSQLFALLRHEKMSFFIVFNMTAAIYVLGTVNFYYLMKKHPAAK